MNEAQVLERLTSRYESLPAPAPSAALLARMDAGQVGDDDTSLDAAVVPLVRPRPRARVRYLVAAVVAGFVAFSGLAAAGALPAPLQRQVSALVSHVGIDLPSPDDGHATPRRPESGRPDGPRAGSDVGATGSGESTPTSTTLAPGAAAPSTAPAGVAAPSGDSPLGGVLGAVGGITGGVTTTTLPPSGGLGLPPVTVPEVTLPPVTLGPITVETTLPPVLPLPPLPLPPLPILGL